MTPTRFPLQQLCSGTPYVLAKTLNENPLQELNSIVISKKLADQFFPEEDTVGREIESLINNSEQMLVVSDMNSI